MPGVTRDLEEAITRAVLESRKRVEAPALLDVSTISSIQETDHGRNAVSAPYFSIVIATHNRPDLLSRSVSSVRSQTFRDFEIIVVSDSSDAGTYQTAGRLLGDADMFIKRTGTPGPASSRNVGIEQANGQYLIFLDDDDSIDADYLEKLYRECEKNRGAVLFCNFHVIQEDRQTTPISTLSENFINLGAYPLTNLHIKNFIPNNAVAYPRTCLEHKRFDTHLKLNEDWDFLLNVLEDNELRFIDISGPRIHKDDPKRLNRRGTQNHEFIVIDLIHVYRRWPGKTDEIKLERQQVLQKAGTNVPIEWL